MEPYIRWVIPPPILGCRFCGVPVWGHGQMTCIRGKYVMPTDEQRLARWMVSRHDY